MKNEIFAKYNSASDEELVYMAQAGDDVANEELYLRFKGIVRIKARSYFILGADRDDIIQEGMIGLFKAIRDYKPDKNAGFRTFAELCIGRQMITAIQNATRMKHVPLNTYVSLSRPISGEENEHSLIDVLPSKPGDNPEELMINQESEDAMYRKINERLTELELNTLNLFMEGKSYQEIATTLNTATKTIDNALQRIKRKVRRIVDEEK